jgi:transposase-like protein
VNEHRSVREVARLHGVSKTWLYELCARYRQGGDAALEPRLSMAIEFRALAAMRTAR